MNGRIINNFMFSIEMFINLILVSFFSIIFFLPIKNLEEKNIKIVLVNTIDITIAVVMIILNFIILYSLKISVRNLIIGGRPKFIKIKKINIIENVLLILSIDFENSIDRLLEFS